MMRDSNEREETVYEGDALDMHAARPFRERPPHQGSRSFENLQGSDEQGMREEPSQEPHIPQKPRRQQKPQEPWEFQSRQEFRESQEPRGSQNRQESRGSQEPRKPQRRQKPQAFRDPRKPQRRQKPQRPQKPRKPYVGDYGQPIEGARKVSVSIGMVALALAIGFVVGFLVFVALWLSSALTNLIWGSVTEGSAPWFMPVVICTLGGLIIGLWSKYIGGDPESLEVVLAKVKRTGSYKLRSIPASVVAFLLPLAFGGSVGLEAGLTGLIAAACTYVGRTLRSAGLRVKEIADLTVSASLSAIFYTPLAGIVIAGEDAMPDDAAADEDGVPGGFTAAAGEGGVSDDSAEAAGDNGMPGGSAAMPGGDGMPDDAAVMSDADAMSGGSAAMPGAKAIPNGEAAVQGAGVMSSSAAGVQRAEADGQKRADDRRSLQSPHPDPDAYTFRRGVKIVLYVAAAFGSIGGLMLLNSFTGGMTGIPRFEAIQAAGPELLWAIPCLAVAYLMTLIHYASERGTRWLARTMERFTVLKPLLAGVVIGCVAMVLPNVLFCGEEQGFEIQQNWQAVGVAVLIATGLAKAAATSLCLNMGWHGGNFFPNIYAGISAGYGIALLTGADPMLCVTVVTSAYLGGMFKRPLLVLALLILCFPVHSIIWMGLACIVGTALPVPSALMGQQKPQE